MENALVKEVTEGLAARKGEWPSIAEELAPDVSLSMIEKLGRGKYTSSPTIGKLERIAGWLRMHPRPRSTPKPQRKAISG